MENGGRITSNRECIMGYCKSPLDINGYIFRDWSFLVLVDGKEGAIKMNDFGLKGGGL